MAVCGVPPVLVTVDELNIRVSSNFQLALAYAIPVPSSLKCSYCATD
jgi:hypothetical protein